MMRQLRSALFAVVLALSAGCSDEAAPDAFSAPLPAQCPVTGTEQSMVISRLVLLRQSAPGVSRGFDLDGRVSGADDSLSCRRRDLTSPEGVTGIDNQFSLLVPALDTATAGALDAAIQAAINNGQLMVAVSIEGVDDRRNDPCVNLVFRRVRGMPFVGSDSRIDPGQTFETMREEPISRVAARMRDGVIEAGPFALGLPVSVLDANFVIPLQNARARIEWHDDDTFEGLIGGGIPAAQMIATTETLTIGADLMGLVRRLILSITDLDPDSEGNCRSFSAAVSFDGRAAFVNP
jgi:hypothetical protein